MDYRSLDDLKEKIESLKEEMAVGRERCLLHGDVMLALDVERLRVDRGPVHELSLRLRGYRVYVPLEGDPVEIVPALGVRVPREPAVRAFIAFFRSPGLEGLWLQRDDEQGGRVFAGLDEVNAAVRALLGYVRKLESVWIDLRRAVPGADVDMHYPLAVSVEGFWRYFKRFRYTSHKGIPDHYNSADPGREDIAFVPGFCSAPDRTETQ